jgi:hypothetical protein
MMRDSEFVDEGNCSTQRSFYKDYAYTQETTKAGDLGQFGVAVQFLWRIRNGIRIDNVGLRLYFWSNRFILDVFAYTGIGTMPITLYGSKNKTKQCSKTLFQVSGLHCLTEPGAGSDTKLGKTIRRWEICHTTHRQKM